MKNDLTISALCLACIALFAYIGFQAGVGHATIPFDSWHPDGFKPHMAWINNSGSIEFTDTTEFLLMQGVKDHKPGYRLLCKPNPMHLDMP